MKLIKSPITSNTEHPSYPDKHKEKPVDDVRLDFYFNQFTGHVLLTKEEEIELGTSIQAWKTNPRAGQGTREKGQKALRKLIESNLRLVIKIAKDYARLGLDVEDLVCEGNIGLLRGAEKFDPCRGAKFSTYASYWIKQSIRRALSNKSRTIRLPVGLIDQKNKVRNFINDYELTHSTRPSTGEICKKFNINAIKLSILLDVDKQTLSIDSKPPHCDESDGRTLGEVIEDGNTTPPDLLAAINSDNAILDKCLRKLTRRERVIIEYRFGLQNKSFETLEKIGIRFEVTRERIRQIEEAALRKLRFWIKKYKIK